MGRQARLRPGGVCVALYFLAASVAAQEFELPAEDHIAPDIPHDAPARAAVARQSLTID